MDLFTTTMSRRWMLWQHRIEPIDISIRSGNQALASVWPLESDLRAGIINPHEYAGHYRELIQERYRADKTPFLPFINSTHPMALMCYCDVGQPCHRHVLVQLFSELAHIHKVPFAYYGEY